MRVTQRGYQERGIRRGSESLSPSTSCLPAVPASLPASGLPLATTVSRHSTSRTCPASCLAGTVRQNKSGDEDAGGGGAHFRDLVQLAGNDQPILRLFHASPAKRRYSALTPSSTSPSHQRGGTARQSAGAASWSAALRRGRSSRSSLSSPRLASSDGFSLGFLTRQ